MAIEGEASFERGSVVGESMVLEARKARRKVIATEPSRVLTLPSARLRRLTRHHPWLGVRLLERMSRRLARRWLDGAPVSV